MASANTYIKTKNHHYISDENKPLTTTNSLLEFNEFDVWNVVASPDLHKSITRSQTQTKSFPMDNRKQVSVPVDVPDWSLILKQEKEKRKVGNEDDDFDFDGDVYCCDELIPPHEYLARERIASFSVHEGFGRTLKGRDLSRVRNAVWKKIGFED
ncbi:hypothetical protein QVD17_32851 [Tagetes erecta]|uniref:Senescence regulator n=1 Tax=Tagetes erecta TaxID=13708 RepID=A0AAD8NKA4_TARER|nr:hypothetical protein QVD17_32851 [Tagetes erecta]